MKSNRKKSLFLILCLVAVSGIAMAYSERFDSHVAVPVIKPDMTGPANSGVVSLSGNLIQHKVLKGSDGAVTLSLLIRADDVGDLTTETTRNVDMVIVMDRSGSMRGRKLEDAKQAVLKLLTGLGAKDRLALIAYSDGVQQYTGLLPVTADNRTRFSSAIRGMRAGGGTNLGAGLQEGINTLLRAEHTGNTGKMILISDGLANKGITNPTQLSQLASIAVKKEFSISTAGVGAEFNEQLMTRIADKGAGAYYYIENPKAFADIFQKEFYMAKKEAVTSVAVQIPLSSGVSLSDASGYPIETLNGQAVFYPGNLRSGQTRKLFLTFRVPTQKVGNIGIDDVLVRYSYNGRPFTARLAQSFQIACVENKKEVFSSINRKKWEEKVLKDDVNKLKQEVAVEIKEGRKQNALDRIRSFYNQKNEQNAVIGSGKVAKSLKKNLGELETVVKDTFTGSPSGVQQKQKLNSKSLQYEGYKGRRAGG